MPMSMESGCWELTIQLFFVGLDGDPLLNWGKSCMYVCTYFPILSSFMPLSMIIVRS